MLKKYSCGLVVLCLAGLLAACDVVEPPEAPVEVAAPEDAVYDSLEALSDALGYPVLTLYTLPMGYEEYGYACQDGAALTTYRHGETGDMIRFYMGRSPADSADVPEDYAAIITCTLPDGTEVTGWGVEELIHLAQWQQGDYSCRLEIEAGADATIFRMMIEDIK